MKYIALLRGINVGGNKKVEMKRLRALFESLGYTEVVTYLNSGNVLFESSETQETLQKIIPEKLRQTFGFKIQTLVKTNAQIKTIAKAIPNEWKNDEEQKTDVAYLFPDADSAKTIDALPIRKEFIDIRYVKGALIWTVKRKDYNKSHLNKIISSKYYQQMTVRNVNTARYLANPKGSEMVK